MPDQEEKDRHSKRRRRNVYAKVLREERFYRPRIKKPKSKDDLRRITPKNVEEYLDDE